MHVLVYLVVLGVITYAINKRNGTEDNVEFLRWQTRDLLIMGGLALLSVVLDILPLPPITLLIHLVICAVALLYVNKNRESYILEYKKQIDQIFASLGKLCEQPKDEIDYNDIPFKIEKDGDKVNEIKVLIGDQSRFSDANCTSAVYSLKRYFPYFDWQYSCDFPSQQCTFTGKKLPPRMAAWPGSDSRTGDFIPLGVSGEGEVGWPLTKKRYGRSEYIFEDGARAGTAGLPTAPHAICVGSTGGGKAVWINQRVW